MNRTATFKKVFQTLEINTVSEFSHLKENTISEKIFKLRKLNKLTLKEFGKKIGKAQSTISNYEHNSKKPTESTLIKICKEFNLDKNYFKQAQN